MKTCILNFSSKDNKIYMKGQRRLAQSLKSVKYKGDVILWQSESQFGCPPHSKVPYAFKPYALDWARSQGYDLALWLDASFYAIRPIEPVFNTIENEGYLMQNDGNRLGHWAHDKCLNKYDMTRDEAMGIKMYAAGCTGLNFANEKAQTYLKMWLEAATDGESFQGPHKYDTKKVSDKRLRGHRHDMSVGSVLAHKLDMKYQKAWTVFTYGRQQDNPNVYFIAQGMK